MDNQEFFSFRQKLQKTQRQIAELLGISLKAVQSFEQGWRKVPVHIERQMLLLLAMERGRAKDARPGPAGIFRTVLCKLVKPVLHGNSMWAICAGLSTGPFVGENLRIAGAIK